MKRHSHSQETFSQLDLYLTGLYLIGLHCILNCLWYYSSDKLKAYDLVSLATCGDQLFAYYHRLKSESLPSEQLLPSIQKGWQPGSS